MSTTERLQAKFSDRSRAAHRTQRLLAGLIDSAESTSLQPGSGDSPATAADKLLGAVVAKVSQLSAAVGGFVTPQQYGAAADGVTDDSAAFQSAADNAQGKPVVIPPGTYALNDQVNVPVGVDFIGSGSAQTILYSNRVAETASLQFAGSNRVLGFKLTSLEYTTPADSSAWDLGSREIRIEGDNVTVADVVVENAGRGFTVEGCNSVQLVGCRTVNCVSRYGTAAGFHFSGAKHCRLTGCSVDGSPRIVEIEDGCEDITVDGLYAVDCCGPKYAGAPAYGTSATQYFSIPYGLDVHNHLGTDACRGIAYRNCHLVNCGAGLRVTQDSVNEINGVLYENILIDGANDSWADSTSARMIHFSGGKNITCRNVRVRGTATAMTELCVLDAGNGASCDTVALDLRVESVLNKAVYCNDAASRRITVAGGRYGYTVSTGSFGIELVAGKGHLVAGNRFYNVKGHSSGVVAMGVEGGQVVGNHFEWDSSGTNCPTCVNVRSNGVAVSGNVFEGGASLTNGYIRVSNNADQFLVSDNLFVGSGAHTFIKIESGSDNGLYAGNRANQVSGVSDAGTGNVSSRNLWNAAPSAA